MTWGDVTLYVTQLKKTTFPQPETEADRISRASQTNILVRIAKIFLENCRTCLNISRPISGLSSESYYVQIIESQDSDKFLRKMGQLFIIIIIEPQCQSTADMSLVFRTQTHHTDCPPYSWPRPEPEQRK